MFFSLCGCFRLLFVVGYRSEVEIANSAQPKYNGVQQAHSTTRKGKEKGGRGEERGKERGDERHDREDEGDLFHWCLLLYCLSVSTCCCVLLGEDCASWHWHWQSARLHLPLPSPLVPLVPSRLNPPCCVRSDTASNGDRRTTQKGSDKRRKEKRREKNERELTQQLKKTQKRKNTKKINKGKGELEREYAKQNGNTVKDSFIAFM